MYVHVVLKNRPWQLTVRHDGKAVFSMTAPIQQERCDVKKKYLDNLFRGINEIEY
jgi:hypothetical protein